MAGTSGGETRSDPSGWSVDTLRSHFDTVLAQMDRRYGERFESQQEAIRRAEQATEKRFESVNEFRAQLADQAREFMSRTEAIQRADANSEKIAALEKRLSDAISTINSRLDIGAGGLAGADKFRTTLIATIAAAVAVVGGIVGLIVAVTQ